jgi:pimeloyl-ACP methyl ester carboxylesterase
MNRSFAGLGQLQKTLYPFKLDRLKLKTTNGFGEMNYVDEGPASESAILCVHGNPTWSFYFRSIINHFKGKRRVIAPDHLGMGLSSRFDNETFTLKDRVHHLVQLLNHLKLKQLHLVVHDWGGPIGMLAALTWQKENPTERKITGLTLLNTSLVRARHVSKRILLCRRPLAPLVKYLGIFNYGLPLFGVARPLSPEVRRGLMLPYHGATNRKAVADFIYDIPLAATDVSYSLMEELEQLLATIEFPVQVLWGEQDFCFDLKYFELMKQFFPLAESRSWQQAGHLILEDVPQEVCATMEKFLN